MALDPTRPPLSYLCLAFLFGVSSHESVCLAEQRAELVRRQPHTQQILLGLLAELRAATMRGDQGLVKELLAAKLLDR